MNVLLANLTAQQLRHAADLRERIDALQNQLSRVLGNTAQTRAPSRPRPQQTRRLSPATIAKLRASAKARWAGNRRASPQTSNKLSAAARARLSAIARERWKRAKAAGRLAL